MSTWTYTVTEGVGAFNAYDHAVVIGLYDQNDVLQQTFGVGQSDGEPDAVPLEFQHSLYELLSAGADPVTGRVSFEVAD